jgi:hypothetical protein
MAGQETRDQVPAVVRVHWGAGSWGPWSVGDLRWGYLCIGRTVDRVEMLIWYSHAFAVTL